MLVNEAFQREFVSKVIDQIIACPNQKDAIDMIKKYKNMWMGIPGTRGNTGKNIINNETTTKTNYVAESIITEKVEKIRKVLLTDLTSQVNNLFEFEDDVIAAADTSDDYEFSEEDELTLSNLEDSIKHE